MSLAIAKAFFECRDDFSDLGQKTIINMRLFGRYFPHGGYAKSFKGWLFADNSQPYNSFGNGAAMRVSACARVAKSLEEVITLSRIVTEVTHNHPEGIKGAEATAVAIYFAQTGKSIEEIRSYIDRNYYSMNFSIDEIRPTYSFASNCQNTVPQAIMAFLDSTSFEDAIRNAVSLGGDSDTLAAITGSIAEAYYGVTDELREEACNYLSNRLVKTLNEFENKFPTLKNA